MEELKPDMEAIASQEGMVNTPERETAPTSDPREYFRLTNFQKLGEQIDGDSSHPWNEIDSDSLIIRTDSGSIVGGSTYTENVETGETQFGLLIAERDGANEGSSILLKGLTRDHIATVTETIRAFAPCLPAESRNAYVRSVVDGLRQVNEEYPTELMARQLEAFSLSSLPDRHEIDPTDLPRKLDWGSQTPTSEQQQEIQGLFQVVGRKMSPEAFQRQIEELQQDLYFANDQFGRNYSTLLSSIARWPVDHDPEIVPDFDSMNRDKPKGFPVTNQITRHFHSQAELSEVLQQLPAEPEPEELFTPGRVVRESPPTAELVELNKVVGGKLDDNSWQVSRSMGRGLDNIFQLVQGFEEDQAGELGQNKPISVNELNGKYYIHIDGRHRTAALKALGVSNYPMMVTHLRDKFSPETKDET